MRLVISVLVPCALAASITAQSPGSGPARPPQRSAVSRPAAPAAVGETIAITNGHLFPVSGPPIDRGTVLIRGVKIVAVGANVPVPPGARVVDAAGKIVTP